MSTKCNENVKNTLWHERCLKERKAIKPSAAWCATIGELERNCLTDKVNRRSKRFLKRSTPILTGDAPNPPSIPSSEAIGQQQEQIRPFSVSRGNRDPKWKNPVATSDDYGWAPSNQHRYWADPRFSHPLGSSDVTRAGENFYSKSAGRSATSKR